MFSLFDTCCDDYHSTLVGWTYHQDFVLRMNNMIIEIHSLCSISITFTRKND